MTLAIANKDCKMLFKCLTNMNITGTTTLEEIRVMKTEPLTSMIVKKQDGTADKKGCYTMIYLCLENIFQHFGEDTTNDALKSQLKSASIIMYSEYYYMKIAEWSYFMQKAKALKFGEGKLYGKLTIATIISWLLDYSSQMDDVIATSQYLEHDKNTYKEKLPQVERVKDKNDKEVLLRENMSKAMSGDFRSHEEKLADYKQKISNNEI